MRASLWLAHTWFKNQRFKKLPIGIVKKITKQGSRYCSFESVECVIHMTGDTVQLEFNYLSYKSLF